MGNPRKVTNLRISESAEQWIEQMAAESSVSKAVMMRAMLAVSTRHPDEIRTLLASLQEVQPPES